MVKLGPSFDSNEGNTARRRANRGIIRGSRLWKENEDEDRQAEVDNWVLLKEKSDKGLLLLIVTRRELFSRLGENTKERESAAFFTDLCVFFEEASGENRRSGAMPKSFAFTFYMK